jgi:oxaloacetate decarboxylase alpha subunit
MAKKKIQITETILRDAHQSLIATRMPLSDMLPILPQLDEIGFYSLECWGGATFDSCIRFLNEDPWERLRTIRKNCPKTKLQMLFRGQNMLGYRHYADDVLEYFVQRSVANGIDVIRIFDALNDIKNLQTAINATRAAKKENPNVEAQVAMSYTTGPIFTTDYYVEYAKQIEAAGADSICIKDMAALLTPYYTEELVKAIKSAVKIPVQLHTHYTSGLASMCLMKAIEAGCDRIDTAMSPLANGTSHAPTESMVAALQGTDYDTGLDLVKLSEIREYFMTLREKYIKSGLLDPKMLATDAKALIYQVPGGMLSNLLKQLKDAGKADKLTEVLNEVPKVRKDAGYPPLVTPTSQIVGTQAVFNVLFGEYKNCSGQFKDLVAGKYGTTPVPIDPEFRRRIIGDEKPVTCRPADLLEPELEKLRAEIPEWIQQEEDVLTYAQFPQVAPKFFKARRDKQIGINPDADLKAKIHPV